MTVTVFIDAQIEKTYVIPNVVSPEEAETIAMERLAEEFGEDVEILSMDSFEGEEEMVN